MTAEKIADELEEAYRQREMVGRINRAVNEAAYPAAG
jgi:hypothetical protein